jgi:hypothetical protein
MFRIVITLLLVAAWHFPTTFFVPGGTGTPQAAGSIIWPFGRATGPVLAGLPGFVAPSSLQTVVASPSIALAAAGISSLAFLVALFSLWGVVIPADWWRPAAIIGSVASIVLFAIYLGPWAIVPMVIHAAVLWGVFVQGWTQTTIVGS